MFASIHPHRLPRTVLALAAVAALALAGLADSGRHTVKRGETLTAIARRYGTTVGALVEANRLRNPNLIVAGQTLTVPNGSSGGTAGGSQTASSSTTAATGYHIVAAGDTLAGIARRYGISVAQLKAANGITDDRIYTGTRLHLSGSGAAAVPVAAVTTTTHKVAAGETLATIARRYGTTVAALAQANGISNPDRIRIGQVLQVSGSSQGGGFSCPVPGTSFFNDWGFPRHGGRFHEGNDLFAPMGTPVLAPAAGRVTYVTGSVGGLQFTLRGDDGTRYIGSHMSKAGTGGQVQPGTVIGYVGDSGNAKGGRPHLHFEVHPNGGAAVNPYPLLDKACR